MPPYRAIRPQRAGGRRTVGGVTAAREVHDKPETPPVTALIDGEHPGWASSPVRESAAARRYREMFAEVDVDPADDPVAVVAIFRDLGAPARLVRLGAGESLYLEVGAALLGGKVSLSDPGEANAQARIATTRAMVEPVRLREAASPESLTK